jgi:hypothetical protein
MVSDTKMIVSGRIAVPSSFFGPGWLEHRTPILDRHQLLGRRDLEKFLVFCEANNPGPPVEAAGIEPQPRFGSLKPLDLLRNPEFGHYLIEIKVVSLQMHLIRFWTS